MITGAHKGIFNLPENWRSSRASTSFLPFCAFSVTSGVAKPVRVEAFIVARHVQLVLRTTVFAGVRCAAVPRAVSIELAGRRFQLAEQCRYFGANGGRARLGQRRLQRC
jgi:hypothetical protein